MNMDVAVAKTLIDTDLQGVQVGDISFSNGKKRVPLSSQALYLYVLLIQF